MTTRTSCSMSRECRCPRRGGPDAGTTARYVKRMTQVVIRLSSGRAHVRRPLDLLRSEAVGDAAQHLPLAFGEEGQHPGRALLGVPGPHGALQHPRLDGEVA